MAADSREQTSGPSGGPRQRGRRRLIALVLVAIVAAATVYLALRPRPPALDRVDRMGIAAAIEAQWVAEGQVLPRRYAQAHTPIPQAVLDRIQTRYLTALRAVVTPEFLARRWAVLDLRRILSRPRSDGVLILSNDFRVMSVTPQRRLANGDLVVWAKVWGGNVLLMYSSGKWGIGESGVARVDDTPVWQYQMRKVAGRWRIVSESLVFNSEDDSPAYGPNTKHWVAEQKLTKGDEGLYLGSPSPEPPPST